MPKASRGRWREKTTSPRPRVPSPRVGFRLGLGQSVGGGRQGQAGAGPRHRVGEGAAQRARADPFILWCLTAPRLSTIPSHTPPANLGTNRTLPRQNSQPVAQLACLIRSSLTSSAKLSRVNPITSNHVI